MINVVFEGPIGGINTTVIDKIKNTYSISYKTNKNYDIYYNSNIYNSVKKMVDKDLFIPFKKQINNEEEMLAHTIDYLYLRKRSYDENNDINLFNRSYFSTYLYQLLLLNKKMPDFSIFMDNLFSYLKNKEKKIDLMVYFDVGLNESIKKTGIQNNKNYTNKEKYIIKKFNKKLKDLIRYNNSDYNLLVIGKNDKENDIVRKINEKIDEIIEDKKKNDDEKWYELYKIDIDEFSSPDKYIEYKLKYKKKFIKKIIKYAENKKVIELGCGTGIVAGYLQNLGLDVMALDLSPSVLKYAQEIAENSNIIKPCKYVEGNILNLQFKKNCFDVSYSNGVLEHFNDEDIIKILKQQLEISRYVVFGIPSTYFNMNEKMLGNERGLTIKEWEKFIKISGGTIVERTGFHYYKFYRRLFEFKKWFKPKAFWLFVIKKKDS